MRRIDDGTEWANFIGEVYRLRLMRHLMGAWAALAGGRKPCRSMSRVEPRGVAGLAERDRRVAELLGGVEGGDREQVLFRGTDDALGAAVALRRWHEGGRTLDAKASFLWK